jgi:hypothetical protein
MNPLLKEWRLKWKKKEKSKSNAISFIFTAPPFSTLNFGLGSKGLRAQVLKQMAQI